MGAFQGDAQDKVLLRSRWKFHAETRMKFMIDRDDVCANHFVVITKDPNFKFKWGSNPGAIIFAWNCEQKVIYGQGKTDAVRCAKLGKTQVDISVGEKQVRFEDSQCKGLHLDETFHDEFYVYLGASQDVIDKASKFFNFDIRSTGTGLAEVWAMGTDSMVDELRR